MDERLAEFIKLRVEQKQRVIEAGSKVGVRSRTAWKLEAQRQRIDGQPREIMDPNPPPDLSSEREAQLEDFTWLREKQGETVQAAGMRVGVTRSVAYELEDVRKWRMRVKVWIVWEILGDNRDNKDLVRVFVNPFRAEDYMKEQVRIYTSGVFQVTEEMVY